MLTQDAGPPSHQQQMQLRLATLAIASTLLACCFGAAAVVDPCSEAYPGLGADFVTTQAKVHIDTHEYCRLLSAGKAMLWTQ